MARKKRNQQSGGESTVNPQQGGRSGTGSGQTGPPQAAGAHPGGGRGYGSQGRGGRGGYGGRGGTQPAGMASQYGEPAWSKGRGAQQHPRGGAPPQCRGGRGSGSSGGSIRPSVPELHQASQGPYPPGSLPPQAMTSGKSAELSEASFSVSSMQAGPSQVEQQLEQLSVQESSSQESQSLPASSKSVRFSLRPGKGSIGTRCIVKANHFFAQLPDKDLHHYDVMFLYSFVLVFFCSSYHL